MVIITILIFIFYILSYNNFINKKNQIENSFSTIDVSLKKRYDLIPNLVEITKKYMEYEKNTFEIITELRSKAMEIKTSNDEKVLLNNELTKKIGRIMAVAENYPELKSNENFLHLQRTLNEIEEQISAARRTYNSNVTDYNNFVEMIPTNIVAYIMKFKRKEIFKATEKERGNIEIKNLF